MPETERSPSKWIICFTDLYKYGRVDVHVHVITIRPHVRSRKTAQDCRGNVYCVTMSVGSSLCLSILFYSSCFCFWLDVHTCTCSSATNKHVRVHVHVEHIKYLLLLFMQALQRLKHVNIIKATEIFRDSNTLYFVFEYMKQNLYELIKSKYSVTYMYEMYIVHMYMYITCRMY